MYNAAKCLSSKLRYHFINRRFLASQMLGAQDVYPGYGDIEGTWCANFIDDNQWIEVSA